MRQQFRRLQPLREMPDPVVGAGARVAHAEAMVAGRIHVQLDGLAGGAPGLEDRHAGVAEQRIVGGQRDKGGRRVGRHRARRRRAIDHAHEIGTAGRVIGGGHVHRRHAAGGKAEHADAPGVDAVIGGVGAQVAQCRQAVFLGQGNRRALGRVDARTSRPRRGEAPGDDVQEGAGSFGVGSSR
jgi:hypothetical protein